MLALIKETWLEVAFLLSLSGGFWVTLEPPVGNLSGVLSSFVGAFIVAAALGVRVFLKHSVQPSARAMTMTFALASLVAAVAMFGTYVADRSYLVLAFRSGDETVELVRGTVYQPSVRAVKESQTITDNTLLAGAGGTQGRESVWTPESILAAERRLTFGYVLSLLFTLLSTMFFVEILRSERTSTGVNRNSRD